MSMVLWGTGDILSPRRRFDCEESFSLGEVFSFTELGMLKENSGWDCCVSVDMLDVGDVSQELIEFWDQKLRTTLNNIDWSKTR